MCIFVFYFTWLQQEEEKNTGWIVISQKKIKFNTICLLKPPQFLNTVKTVELLKIYANVTVKCVRIGTLS